MDAAAPWANRQLPEVGAAATAIVLAVAGALLPRASLAQNVDISTGAFQLLSQRTEAVRAGFAVFIDQDSGLNHGFPSGKFNRTNTNLSEIDPDPGCVDDASASNGCSTSTASLDQSRGTVMRVTFGPQTAGNYAGLNIEEPKDWGTLGTGAGYDLTGVTTLALDIRSPDSAMVQIGVGGCTTGYFQVPVSWTALTVPLSSLSCPSAPDLSSVHILFGVAVDNAHAPSGGTVLLDNIHFEATPPSQQTVLGFPLSNQTFGVVPQTTAPIPSDQVLRNLTTIYESSLTLIALIARGQAQDLSDARLIADAFDQALHHDIHGDGLPASPDGSTGLHNGYRAGALALFNSQVGDGQGLAGDSQLAGFTGSATLCHGSTYCVVLDGATGGNNAFAILALLDAYRQFKDSRYLNDAELIGHWIIGNLQDTSVSGYGGYWVGYGDGGVPPPKPLVCGKSTENNADIFLALTLLAAVENSGGNSAGAADWNSAAAWAGDFVMRMYDPNNGRFNAGTTSTRAASVAGTCLSGIANGNEAINSADFLDTSTFTTLAMAGATRYHDQIDWRRPITYVTSHFASSVNAAGIQFSGYDLIPPAGAGSTGIAWEFTGQVAVTMKYLDALYAQTSLETSAADIVNQLRLAQTSAPFTDGNGVVASTLPSGDLLAPLDQCLSTPYQCIAERVGLAATAWAIFAETGNNPFLPAVRFAQTIAFDPIPAPQFVTGTLTLSASAAPGLPVTFTSQTPAVCEVSGANVTLLLSGTCSIQADQVGDAIYSAAQPVVQNFSVGTGTQPQAVTFDALPPRVLGGAPFVVTASASSGLPVVFSTASPAFCSVSGSTVTLIKGGICRIAADQPGNETYAPAPEVTQLFAVISNPTPQRSYVSLLGDDGNNCGPTAPCRSWQAALAQTQPGGEILTLDSGGYGLLNIQQAVTLVVPPGVYGGMSPPAGQSGVVITAPGARVVLKGLSIAGQGGTAGLGIESAGVDIESAGEVVIDGANVESMATGILARNAGALQVSRSRVHSNSGSGIVLEPATGSLVTVISGSSLSYNGNDGVSMANGVQLELTDCDLTGNGTSGIGWGINATATTPAPSAAAALPAAAAIAIDAQRSAFAFNASGGLSIADLSGATLANTAVGAVLDHNDLLGGIVCVNVAGGAAMLLADNSLYGCATGVVTATGNTQSLGPAGNRIRATGQQTDVGGTTNAPLPLANPR